MASTVDDIQSRVSGIVDQNQDTSAISSNDYSLRLSFINRRERMWAEVGRWDALVREYNTLTSTNTANASISLPADFRSLAGFPEITYDGKTTKDFTEIKAQDEGRFDKNTQAYVKIMGTDLLGRTMVVNTPSSNKALSSGASVKVLYYSTPTSLASPADITSCPNPEYLIQGVVADVWESKQDPRYSNAKVEANLILQNMIEYEHTPSEASYSRNVKSSDEVRFGYRWGK